MALNLENRKSIPKDLRSAVRQAIVNKDQYKLCATIQQVLNPESCPSDVIYTASRIKELEPAAAKELGLKTVQTWCARSVTVEPIVPYLITHAAMAGLRIDIKLGGYGSFIDEMVNPQGVLLRSSPELVLLLLDADDFAGQLPDACSKGETNRISDIIANTTSLIEKLIIGLRKHSTASLLIQGLLIPDNPVLGDITDVNVETGHVWAMHQLNHAIADLCRKNSNVVYFDQDHLAGRYGRSNWRDNRMFLSTRLGISSRFFSAYAKGIVKAIRPFFHSSCKVLCTDLDNTLWGGIVGEDGPDNILTGPDFPGNGFQSYQRYLKELAARGVLLTIVSKNNEDDVIEVFNKRGQDILVSLNDFASKRIGWQSKSEYIRSIADELSLGLSSFVFVDDSSVECEAMRLALPEVKVIQTPLNEPWKVVNAISESGYFDTHTITADDRNRLTDYKAQLQRDSLKKQVTSKEDFLASLDMVCQVVNALEAPLNRTVQLLSKTNQFNLTTRRHAASEVEAFANTKRNIVVAIRARDRFGDSGVVGVAICRLYKDIYIIDTFLLSCRVIGRGIESALLWYISNEAVKNGVTCLVGEYMPTSKNSVCSTFYTDHGFSLLSEYQEDLPLDLGSKRYELNLEQHIPEKPQWISFV